MNKSIELLLKFRDEASSGLKAVSEAANQAASKLDGVSKSTDKSSETSKSAKKELDGLKSSLLSAIPGLNGITAAFSKATGAMTSASAAAVGLNVALVPLVAIIGTVVAGLALFGGAFAAGFSAAKDFQKEMQNVNTILNVSNEELSAYSEQVVALANQLGMSAVEAAKALYDIASAGFKGSDGLLMLEAAQKAAVAGNVSLTESSKVIASVLNAYGLDASKAGEVSDKLFTVVKNGVITFKEFQNGLGDVLPIASAAGVSIDDLGAVIATLTSKGIQGSKAFTTTKAMLEGLLNPTESAAKEMEKYGISIDAATLKQKGLLPVLQEMMQKTGGNVDILKNFFGSTEALNGVLAVYGDQLKTTKKNQDDLKNATGATDEAFKKQNDTIESHQKAIANLSNNIKMQFGQVIEPVVRNLLGAIRGGLEWIAQYDFKAIINNIGVAVNNALAYLEYYARATAAAATMPFEVFYKAVTKILNIGQTAIQNVGEALKALASGNVNAAKGFMDAAGQAISGIGNVFAESILEGWDNFKTKLGAEKQNLQKSLKEYQDIKRSAEIQASSPTPSTGTTTPLPSVEVKPDDKETRTSRTRSTRAYGEDDFKRDLDNLRKLRTALINVKDSNDYYKILEQIAEIQKRIGSTAFKNNEQFKAVNATLAEAQKIAEGTLKSIANQNNAVEIARQKEEARTKAIKEQNEARDEALRLAKEEEEIQKRLAEGAEQGRKQQLDDLLNYWKIIQDNIKDGNLDLAEEGIALFQETLKESGFTLEELGLDPGSIEQALNTVREQRQKFIDESAREATRTSEENYRRNINEAKNIWTLIQETVSQGKFELAKELFDTLSQYLKDNGITLEELGVSPESKENLAKKISDGLVVKVELDVEGFDATTSQEVRDAEDFVRDIEQLIKSGNLDDVLNADAAIEELRRRIDEGGTHLQKFNQDVIRLTEERNKKLLELEKKAYNEQQEELKKQEEQDHKARVYEADERVKEVLNAKYADEFEKIRALRKELEENRNISKEARQALEEELSKQEKLFESTYGKLLSAEDAKSKLLSRSVELSGTEENRWDKEIKYVEALIKLYPELEAEGNKVIELLKTDKEKSFISKELDEINKQLKELDELLAIGSEILNFFAMGNQEAIKFNDSVIKIVENFLKLEKIIPNISKMNLSEGLGGVISLAIGLVQAVASIIQQIASAIESIFVSKEDRDKGAEYRRYSEELEKSDIPLSEGAKRNAATIKEAGRHVGNFWQATFNKGYHERLKKDAEEAKKWLKEYEEHYKRIASTISSQFTSALTAFAKGEIDLAELKKRFKNAIYQAVLDGIVGALVNKVLIEGLLKKDFAGLADALASGDYEAALRYAKGIEEKVDKFLNSPQGQQILDLVVRSGSNFVSSISGGDGKSETTSSSSDSSSSVNLGVQNSGLINIVLYDASAIFRDSAMKFSASVDVFAQSIKDLTTKGIAISVNGGAYLPPN
ncbi:MAG: phage tail tape measure protein [Candidatus Diapherotrites archaeon]